MSETKFTIQLSGQEVLQELGFLRLTRYQVRHTSLDPARAKLGGKASFSDELTRIDVFRKDAVAGLLHLVDTEITDTRDPARQQLFFVEQFRFSTLIDPNTGQPTLPPKGKSPGVFRELMAGVITPGEPPRESFIRETQEETGFVLKKKDVVPIGDFYPSPGACSERVYLFYGRVIAGKKWKEAVAKIRGADADEEIRLHHTSAEDFLDDVAKGKWKDAKALIAAEWMRRPGIWDKWFND